MNWPKLFLYLMLLGLSRPLHAAMYVDPAGTSTLLRVLAPVFILLSALSVQFKHRLFAMIRRLFHRSEAKNRRES